MKIKLKVLLSVFILAFSFLFLNACNELDREGTVITIGNGNIAVDEEDAEMLAVDGSSSRGFETLVLRDENLVPVMAAAATEPPKTQSYLASSIPNLFPAAIVDYLFSMKKGTYSLKLKNPIALSFESDKFCDLFQKNLKTGHLSCMDEMGEVLRKEDENEVVERRFLLDGTYFALTKDGILSYRSPQRETGTYYIVSGVDHFILEKFGNLFMKHKNGEWSYLSASLLKRWDGQSDLSLDEQKIPSTFSIFQSRKTLAVYAAELSQQRQVKNFDPKKEKWIFGNEAESFPQKPQNQKPSEPNSDLNRENKDEIFSYASVKNEDFVYFLLKRVLPDGKIKAHLARYNIEEKIWTYLPADLSRFSDEQLKSAKLSVSGQKLLLRFKENAQNQLLACKISQWIWKCQEMSASSDLRLSGAEIFHGDIYALGVDQEWKARLLSSVDQNSFEFKEKELPILSDTEPQLRLLRPWPSL